MEIAEPLFGCPRTIASDAGDVVEVSALDKITAARFADALVKIHSLIPFVHWTKDELLSDAAGNRLFRHKWQLSIIATRALDDPIGFLISYLRPADGNFGKTSVYMHRMAIREELQRKGIGRRAVSIYLEAVFSKLPVDYVTLQTNDNRKNAPIVSFYESLGFVKTKRVFYPEKTDWVMVRPRSLGSVIPRGAR